MLKNRKKVQKVFFTFAKTEIQRGKKCFLPAKTGKNTCFRMFSNVYGPSDYGPSHPTFQLF